MYIFFFLFIFCITQEALAQEGQPRSPWNVGASGHYGYIIPHSKAIRQVANSNPRGVQVDVSKHLTSQKVWDQCKCYPKVGGSFTYFNYDNPKILGSSWNLIAFIEPFITHKYKVNPSFRMGAGISYLNNIYDPVTNPDNLFYSSPISFIILASVNVNFRLSEQWNLNVGGSFNHISNGRMKQPNKGINFPTIKLGANYYFTPTVFPDRKSGKTLDEIFPDKWQYNLAFFKGLKEVEERGKKYTVLGAAGTVGRILTRVNSLHTGIEWLYDNSIKERNQRAGEKVGEPAVWAYLLGHELMMGRFSFTQTLGFYINKPFPTHSDMFHRWGLYYKPKDIFYFGVNLKVHKRTADFLEFRAGISL